MDFLTQREQLHLYTSFKISEERNTFLENLIKIFTNYSHLKIHLDNDDDEFVEIDKLINEENKIIRAQALAERYIDRINNLIVQAKNSGLLVLISISLSFPINFIINHFCF